VAKDIVAALKWRKSSKAAANQKKIMKILKMAKIYRRNG
jgi:hypothetical protein